MRAGDSGKERTDTTEIMKKNYPKSAPRLAVAICAVVTAGSHAIALGQEENLQAALEMQEKRIEGLNSLADKIKNFNFFGLSSKVVTKLDERERSEDPFGMAMDPENDLPEIEVPEIEDELEIDLTPTTSLQEALQRFNITGIFPGQQMIIVGAQNLGINDKIVIEYSGVTFKLQIDKITQTEIHMQDIETGEVGIVSTGFGDALPAGMSRKKPATSSEQESRQAQTIIPFSQQVIKVD